MSIYYRVIRPLIKNIFYSLCTSFLKILSFLFFWICPEPLDSGNINRILLIKIEHIGDLVLSTAAIRAIREHFPHSSITMLVNPYTKAIVDSDPHLDEVVVYDAQGIHKSLIEKIRFIRNLRSKEFSLAIDLDTRSFLFTSVWLAYLSRAKVTLGLDGFSRGFLFNIKVKPYSQPRPLAEEVLHILLPLGIAVSDMQPRLFLSRENKSYIQGFLNREGVKEDDLLVIIHPGGYYETQWWTKEGYAKVAQHLIGKYGAKTFLVGGHKEKKLVNEIIALMSEKPINLAGKISLGQLMALISRCHLFIGNNSGPLNVALGFDIPTISFLGSGIPERWRPQGEKHIVFRKDLPCSPCQLGYCWRRDFACMREIKPEEVIEAVDRQLEKR